MSVDIRAAALNECQPTSERSMKPAPLHPIQWMFACAEEPVFAQADILGLTDLSAVTLQNWMNRGYLTPLFDKPGKAGRRMFSSVHLAVLIIASKLVKISGNVPSALSLSRLVLHRAILFFVLDKSELASYDDFRRYVAVFNLIEDDVSIYIDVNFKMMLEFDKTDNALTYLAFGRILVKALDLAQAHHLAAQDWSAEGGERLASEFDAARRSVPLNKMASALSGVIASA